MRFTSAIALFATVVAVAAQETDRSDADHAPAVETDRSDADHAPAVETDRSDADHAPAAETDRSDADHAPAAETDRSDADHAPAVTSAPGAQGTEAPDADGSDGDGSHSEGEGSDGDGSHSDGEGSDGDGSDGEGGNLPPCLITCIEGIVPVGVADGCASGTDLACLCKSKKVEDSLRTCGADQCPDQASIDAIEKYVLDICKDYNITITGSVVPTRLATATSKLPATTTPAGSSASASAPVNVNGAFSPLQCAAPGFAAVVGLATLMFLF